MKIASVYFEKQREIFNKKFNTSYLYIVLYNKEEKFDALFFDFVSTIDIIKYNAKYF